MRQTDSGWLASTPKKLSEQSRPFGESLARVEPALGKFLAAIGHVFAAEHAEPEHLLWRQFRLEFRIETAPGRGAAHIAVALLHLVADGDGALRHATPVANYGLRFLRPASGFATSRAQSMKSCATGLGVRFFSMIIPIGALAIGNSTGNFLMNGCRTGNCSRNSGTIER